MLKEIKSTFILKHIFNNIKNKKKLKIIKYNKKILKRLDITIENYESYCLIKKFNSKFDLEIEDIDIKELDLIGKNITNFDLNRLKETGIKDLKRLYLCSNEISFIPLQFNKLEILSLGNNNIKDIYELENLNFNYLKELYLYDNLISDIKILEKIEFPKLEILSLAENLITDINILEKVNFKELKKLYLGNKMIRGNNISDINVLNKVKFEKLELLDLSMNNIKDINILAYVNFKNLRVLNLKENIIQNINSLSHFEELEFIDLSRNKIKDINVFLNDKFRECKSLYLEMNNIEYFEVLDKAKFKKLEKLHLYGNPYKIGQYHIIRNLKSKIKEVLYSN